MINNALCVAVCQMKTVNDKSANLKRAKEMITRSAASGGQLIVLPEIFNAPYQADLFPLYAEPYGGPTTSFLAEMAAGLGICIIGGSIPEIDDGRIYNSSFVFGSQGHLLACHRKAHLFDINIPGKISFKESSTLSSGDKITVFDYENYRCGIMICYDIRFPEMARMAVLEGANLLVVPAAFNLTTGPAHWEILMRSRAIDNQLFVVAASPARNHDASYQAWGHSMIIDPWGTIIAHSDENEQIIASRLDLSLVSRVRSELPLLKQRRTDLYRLEY